MISACLNKRDTIRYFPSAENRSSPVKVTGGVLFHVISLLYDPLTGRTEAFLSDCEKNGVRIRVPTKELVLYEFGMN